MASTPNYDINYDDKRFTEVESDKNAALTDLEKTYGGMISESDKYYDKQIQASKDWADKQSQMQQEQTDFAIEQIERQKGQAKKDYTKEQSGAYVDWQKQSNQYGANAEQMAAMGMQNGGFSESSQVSMYNTYQNRVVAARESYTRAVLNYDNAIKEARLQNNSILAEIAYEALQQQLELSLQGFQYKNTLILEKANQKRAIDSEYYKRYQDVVAQINEENRLKETVRQNDRTYALQERSVALDEAKFAYQKQKDAEAKAAAKAAAAIKKTKAATTKKKYDMQEKKHNASVKKTSKSSSSVSATDYLNKLISSGASKDKVSNEIALALRNGAITKAEAAKLRSTFTPRGIQY